MKEFIRKHPWRLEILPLICVIFALVVPLIYHEQTIAFVRSKHGLTPEQTWWGWYIFSVFGVLGCFISNLSICHLSAQFHIDRKKDWYYCFFTAFVGFMSSLFLLHSYIVGWMLIVWLVLLFSSWAIQKYLLRTLPSVPEPTVPIVDLKSLLPSESEQPEDAVKPGEPFYYRETINNKASMDCLPRNTAIKLRLFSWLGGVVLIGILFFVEWWTSKDLHDMLSGLVWPVVILIGIQVWDRIYGKGTFFSVTPQRIKIRTDSGKKINIRMADVTGCEVVESLQIGSDEHLMMQINLDEISKACKASSDEVPKELQYMANVLRRLEIHTKSGKTYTFRLGDPDKVCGLINAAMVGEQSER